WGLCQHARDIAAYYLKVQHVREVMGPGHVEWNSKMFATEIMLDRVTNLKAVQALLARAADVLEPFHADYDAVSVGPAAAGPVRASNAHVLAVLLARHWVELNHRHGLESVPLGATAAETADDVLRALPTWQENAERFYARLTAVAGTDYAASFGTWINMVRVESAKMLGTLPADLTATTSYEERKIIDTLKKAGRRLLQRELIPAGGWNDDNGSIKTILSRMRQAGLIDNKKDSRGKGYGLREWGQ
ncbi:MAG TPA: hypothetical protein VK324_01690, partial [Tepidisphaeraceae bacterium]|nr:hypothetical protein [Tepidisphaeraceae bacterium]